MMVKGWIGAAGRGPVGAAPLMERGPMPGNFSYPDVPGLEPIIDCFVTMMHNPQSGYFRGAGNWPYGDEEGLEPLSDQGSLRRVPQTSKAHGHTVTPYNSTARGLALRTDAKIRRPWMWP